MLHSLHSAGRSETTKWTYSPDFTSTVLPCPACLMSDAQWRDDATTVDAAIRGMREELRVEISKETEGLVRSSALTTHWRHERHDINQWPTSLHSSSLAMAPWTTRPGSGSHSSALRDLCYVHSTFDLRYWYWVKAMSMSWRGSTIFVGISVPKMLLMFWDGQIIFPGENWQLRCMPLWRTFAPWRAERFGCRAGVTNRNNILKDM